MTFRQWTNRLVEGRKLFLERLHRLVSFLISLWSSSIVLQRLCNAVLVWLKMIGRSLLIIVLESKKSHLKRIQLLSYVYFRALSIELRLGLTYREKYEQKLYASALARFTAIDLALIKLSTNIRVTNLVKPALLPRWSQLNDALVGRLATVCGMGIENQKTSAISNYLQYTQLEIISLADCNKIYGNVDSSKICAKHKTALSSTCPGLNLSRYSLRTCDADVKLFQVTVDLP